jgi:hypothetical protein
VVPPAGKRRALACDHRVDDLQRFLEAVEPIGESAELEAQLAVFELEPTGTDPEDSPAGADPSSVVMILASSVGFR